MYCCSTPEHKTCTTPTARTESGFTAVAGLPSANEDRRKGEMKSLTFRSAPRKEGLPKMSESSLLDTTLMPTTFSYAFYFKVLFIYYAAGLKTGLR